MDSYSEKLRINGLQPGLELVYNGARGSGYFGHGWALSGISSVKRCTATEELDGFYDPTDLDSNDQYCLGGQRLVLIGGTHGNPGAKYHKEIHDGTVVEIQSNASNIYFLAYTPDGNISEYGSTLESKIERPSFPQQTAVWDLKRISDRYGNQIVYEYADQEAGIHRLYRVIYNGYEVYLNYDHNGDNLRLFAGPLAPFIVDAHVSAIEIKKGSTRLYHYEIDYINPTPDVRLIERVKRCDQQSNCTPGTTFNWDVSKLPGLVNHFEHLDRVPGLENNGFVAGHSTHLVGRFNEDSAGDILQLQTDGTHYVALGSTDGTFNRIASDTGISVGYWKGQTSIQGGDFDGDGFTDVLMLQTDGNHYIAFSDGDGTFTGYHRIEDLGRTGYDAGSTEIIVSDFDGDSRADIGMFKADGNHLIAYSDGRNEFIIDHSPTQIEGRGYIGGETLFLPADFNRDGKLDLLRLQGNGDHEIYLSAGFRAFERQERVEGIENRGVWIGGAQPVVADFNGDGMTDFSIVQIDGNQFLAISQGLGRFHLEEEVVGIEDRGYVHEHATIRGIDANLDGLTDILRLQSDGDHFLAINRGDYGFLYQESVSGLEGVAHWGGNGHQHTRQLSGDFNGDGVTDILSLQSDGNHYLAWGNVQPVLLDSITDDFGLSMFIEYGSVEDDYYSETVDPAYPYLVLDKPLNVVTVLSTETLKDTYQDTRYEYSDQMVHLDGGGNLGFREIKSTVVATGVSTTRTFSQDWDNRTVGTVLTTVTRAGNIELSRTVNELDHIRLHNDKVVFPYTRRSSSDSTDLDGTFVSTGSSESEMLVTPNGYVVLAKQTSCFSENDYGLAQSPASCDQMAWQHKTTTDYVYVNESEMEGAYSKHLPRLVSNKTVRSEVPFVPPFENSGEKIVSTAFSYFPTGALKTETIQPGSSQALVTSLQYNGKGQVLTTTVDASDIAARTTTNFYESDTHHRLIETRNALGHRVEFLYQDDRFPWLVTRTHDVNQLVSTAQHDSLGRVTQTTDASGMVNTTTTAWCNGCPVSGAVFFVANGQSGAADVFTYFDEAGREIARRGTIFDNGNPNEYQANISYDSLGYAHIVSVPSFTLNAPQTQTFRDILGRPTRIAAADGGDTYISYHGRTVISTNPAGQQVTEVKDVVGNVIRTIDADGNLLQKQYDSHGNLVRTIDPHNNQITIQYDSFGRKIKMDDPDQGLWTYGYYSDGSLRSQTDARNQTTTMTYDVLGRMTQRVDHDGLVSNWTFDQGQKAIGKLSSETSTNGFGRTVIYDSLGRASQVNTTIEGQNYSNQTSYDSLGRVSEVQYPTGYRTLNHYHPSLGILQKVTEKNSGKALWEAKSYNAVGELEAFKLGTNLNVSNYFDRVTGRLTDVAAWVLGPSIVSKRYSWDNVGNLTSRDDLITGVTDVFSYDALNRLTSASTTSPDHNYNVTVNYDVLGNITFKSDVGAYGYGAGRPHAVSAAGSFNMGYDANGNMISKDSPNAARVEVAYTSFNKPATFSKTSGESVSFKYGPNRKRFKRTDSSNGTTTTTHYVGGSYEKKTGGGQTVEKIYIGGFAVVIKENGTETTNFLIKDHLGSVIAVTDYSGFVQERMEYDAWGKRRHSSSDVNLDLFSFTSQFTNRGYTGHEHIDMMGLIHMNGRVYDPTLGRFLSADPFIQFPDNLQSYNRYSYVLNNPLKFTDPSGYFSFSKFVEGVVKTVVGVVLVVVGVAGDLSCGCGSAIASAGVALIDDGVNNDLNQAFDNDGRDRRKGYGTSVSYSTSFDPTLSAIRGNNVQPYNEYGYGTNSSIANNPYASYASFYEGVMTPGNAGPGMDVRDIVKGLMGIRALMSPVGLFASMTQLCGSSSGACDENEDDEMIFFRGDAPGKTEFWAAMILNGASIEEAQQHIIDLGVDALAFEHAGASWDSPFISVSSDRRTAELYGKGQSVYEIRLKRSDVINNHKWSGSIVDPALGTSRSDSEYLVPFHIPSSAIIREYPSPVR